MQLPLLHLLHWLQADSEERTPVHDPSVPPAVARTVLKADRRAAKRALDTVFRRASGLPGQYLGKLEMWVGSTAQVEALSAAREGP